MQQPAFIEIVADELKTHRQAAFEAGQWLIDTLKQVVPIWKKENWADGQTGFAVQLTPLTDNNTAPWTRVMDVTFRHNVVRPMLAGGERAAGCVERQRLLEEIRP